MVKLGVVSGDKYTFYEGRKRIITIESDMPIPKEDVEDYRSNPKQLLELPEPVQEMELNAEIKDILFRVLPIVEDENVVERIKRVLDEI